MRAMGEFDGPQRGARARRCRSGPGAGSAFQKVEGTRSKMLCSIQHRTFRTLLDRPSEPHAGQASTLSQVSHVGGKDSKEFIERLVKEAWFHAYEKQQENDDA